MYLHIKAVLYLRWLVAGFPLRRPRFDHSSGYVGFVVDKVELGHFPPSTRFPGQFSSHRMFYICLSPRAAAVGPLVASAPSGLSLTPIPSIKKKRKYSLVRYTKLQRMYTINVCIPFHTHFSSCYLNGIMKLWWPSNVIFFGLMYIVYL
jgi:hypothetical protein